MKLAKHSAFNLVGLGAPLLVALVSIPALLHALGAERFGLLTLVWAVTSYFGLFDFGLGRSLTQLLAVALARGQREDIGPLSFTALSLMAALGGLTALLLALGAPWIVHSLRQVTDIEETVAAFSLMAVALPAITVTAGLRGMLEAKHAFLVVNALRLPLGLWTFAGPWLMVAWFGPDLVPVVAALVAGRWAALMAHLVCVRRTMPELRARWHWQPRWLPSLCVAGGWLTLGNLVSPFMGYVDRFVIGVAVSAAAVAYYVTPQELVTKVWIVPGAVTAVLFPTFAAQIARQDASAGKLFGQSVVALALILLPITAGLALFAHELLAGWIGPELASHSAPLLTVFSIGIFVNCLAHVPLTYLQSAGEYRAPALLYCVELPVFVLLLWWATEKGGLMGATTVWLLRMVVDAGCLFWLAASRIPAQIDIGARTALLVATLATLTFLGVLLESASLRVLWLVGASAAAAFVAWWHLRSLARPAVASP